MWSNRVTKYILDRIRALSGRKRPGGTSGTRPAPGDALFANLKRLGFYPRTVFDVGVAKGTPWLYSAYPDAFYYLVEPVDSFAPFIEEHLKNLRGTYVKVALAARRGKAKFYIPGDVERRNIATLSFRPEMVPADTIAEIEVTTLDEMMAGAEFALPALLKTDCQGYDLDVAKGGVETLKKIDFVITETPVYGPWGGGPELKDYIEFYYAHDFILYDMMQPLRRPHDNRLHSVDLCFASLRCPFAQRGLYTSGGETLARSRKHYGF